MPTRKVAAEVLWRAVWLCVVVMALGGCMEQQPWRIGFIGGLTGKAADLGMAARNGTRLAVEEANAAGGVAGRLVELVVRDDAQRVDLAGRAVSELLAARVDAIVGPTTSAMAEVVLPLTASSGLAVVSPTVAGSGFSGRDDHFFRVVASTREHASASARYLAQTLGLRRVAVILDQGNEAYTADWVKHFSGAFLAAGGEVLLTETFFSSHDASLQEPVARLLAVRPDAVLIAAGALDMARISQLVRRRDTAIALMGTTWAATEELVSVGGRAVEGAVVPQMFDRDDNSARYAAFRSAYLDRFGEQPGYASVAAYDATRLVLDALARGGSGERVRQMLIDHEFDGLQGRLKIDAWGDTRRDVFMTTIRNGRFSVEAKLPGATP
ncbi:ABC transporter substrate-binding protein [Aromatoleum diolicum]|uniref:ABC transporter substrate-binding protein n=1 Tax=Aromatoleum diolicum TaxID=75796 RepID=A0ABX1QFV7_9RHOO|nr:ABC transporter substrate-binding protein [Aromatoleum diolicum]NMG77331.1 ABC transporter substrate-binding protein [Aromatoleum diolicum]